MLRETIPYALSRVFRGDSQGNTITANPQFCNDCFANNNFDFYYVQGLKVYGFLIQL